MRALRSAFALAVLAAALVGFARESSAQGMFGGPGFTPEVPVSAFARPAAWFDPSKLQFATEVAFGSSSGRGMEGLQVTRLSYQFGAPLAMRVSLGNAFGANAGQRNGQLFLEGLDLSYRPFKSFMVNVHYQDVRTPLQYGRTGVYDPFYGGWR